MAGKYEKRTGVRRRLPVFYRGRQRTSPSQLWGAGTTAQIGADSGIEREGRKLWARSAERAAKKDLTNDRLYGNFSTERNNRNDRHYKSDAFSRSSEIHPPLGR